MSVRPPVRAPADALPRVELGARVVALPIAETDTALVMALCAGRRDARAALFDRYGLHVERVLLRVMGPDSELADLLQDVFVAAFESIHKLKDPLALRSWLLGIAINKAHKRIRKRQRWRFIRFTAPECIPEIESHGAPSEVRRALQATYAILDSLPAEERVAFALRFIEGMDLRQIAEACEISLATVKRRLGRAQKRFAERARHEEALIDFVEQGTRWP